MQELGDLVGPGGCNEGFLRDDALLLVIMVTRGTDWSGPYNPDVWASMVLDAKGGEQDAVIALGINPGRLVSGGEDGMIRVWDPVDGRELMTLAGHDGAVLALATSADHKRLISAGVDGSIRLWSLRRGREQAALHGHAGAVVGVGVVGSDHLVSVGVDRSLRLWSMADRHCSARLEPEPPDPVGP